MTRPYSEDLRERAFARIEAGETIGSIAQALGNQPVLRLEVSPVEASDRLAFARQIGGQKTGACCPAKWPNWLRERCDAGLFTTRGLAAELAARGVKTDRRVVWVFLHAEAERDRPDIARKRRL
jgi:transposase